MTLRRYTRREALAHAGRTGVAGTVIVSTPPRLLAPSKGVLTQHELATLRAAVSRIVPAEGVGDWSAADVGADNYILGLLAGTGRIYAGGPFRSRFARFQ